MAFFLSSRSDSAFLGPLCLGWVDSSETVFGVKEMLWVWFWTIAHICLYQRREVSYENTSFFIFQLAKDPKWFGRCSVQRIEMTPMTPKWTSYSDCSTIILGINHQRVEWRDVWKNKNIQGNNMSERSCKKFWFFILRHLQISPENHQSFSPTRKWASRENGAIRHSILRAVTPCDAGIGKPNERVEENIPSETAWCTNSPISGWIGIIWNINEYHINAIFHSPEWLLVNSWEHRRLVEAKNDQ